MYFIVSVLLSAVFGYIVQEPTIAFIVGMAFGGVGMLLECTLPLGLLSRMFS